MHRYFAFRNQYEIALSGGPHLLIGDFLNTPSRLPFMEYISGGVNKEDVDYLNNVLFKIIENSEKCPKLYLQIGKSECSELKNLNVLMEKLKEKKFTCDVRYYDYDDHKDIGQYFTLFDI